MQEQKVGCLFLGDCTRSIIMFICVECNCVKIVVIERIFDFFFFFFAVESPCLWYRMHVHPFSVVIALPLILCYLYDLVLLHCLGKTCSFCSEHATFLCYTRCCITKGPLFKWLCPLIHCIFSFNFCRTVTTSYASFIASCGCSSCQLQIESTRIACSLH